MQLKVIRKGSKGELVKLWQNFLVGQGYYKDDVDGKFGPITDAATRKWQGAKCLAADGIVGNKTWGLAMRHGLSTVIAPPADGDKQSPVWPPRPTPSVLSPVTHAERVKYFGTIIYRPAPTASNPERIIVSDDWKKQYLTQVHLPQLKGIDGAPKSCRIWCHKKAAQPLQELWRAWDDAGKLNLILVYEGCLSQRFCRGSRTYLSNHSWGTALDINYGSGKYNRLGHQPLLVGELGSTRELAEIASQLGWWWGGWGWPKDYARLDGMHFELGKKKGMSWVVV